MAKTRSIVLRTSGTVEQIEGIVGAIDFGPLPDDIMAEIEGLIDRQVEGELERVR